MEQDQPNPTAGDGGASTLDPLERIERMLAAEDAPETPDPKGDGESADSVKSEEGATDDAQPQITTTDLAKFLGVDETLLDLDEDGSVKFKAKIDGQERTAKLADVIKTYQIQGHAENRAREVAKQEEALRTRQQEAEQHFQQRIQYAENLTNAAANHLLQEFQNINWNALEQQDPGQAALLRQKFQDRQAHLRGVFENLQREKTTAQQKTDAETRQSLQREAERLPELIPEWKDASVAAKERAEIRDWAIKAGYEPQEIDTISKAHHVAMLRKAMLADRINASKPAIENKVRTAPKLVKPGQAPQNTQEQTVRGLKQSVQKTGGKKGSLEAYLMATGRA